MSTNSEKAKQLYFTCDDVNPKESILMPLYFDGFTDRDIAWPMTVSMLINLYAINNYENDWIPFTKDTFSTPEWDKAGWASYKLTINGLEKEGLIETKSGSGQKYIRLTDDRLFTPDIYKNPEES